MKSSYERDNFRKLYWLVAGIFLTVSLVLMFYLGMTMDGASKLVLIIIGVTEIILVILLFIPASKYIDAAYGSVEDASDIMLSIIEEAKEKDDMSESLKKIEDYKASELREGSIGIFYDSFEKLISMFQEGKRKEKSEKEYLRDVMSDISHQLKTPLASMDVFLDLIVNDKINSEDERKMILSEASNQISRMEWMVLSMLKLARIEAGAIEFEINEVNVSAVLSEVAGSVKYLTDTRNQKLSVSCDEDITIKADSQWLTEAIINIVKNASDYSKEGEDIDIHVEKNSVFTRICISDHGMGMSEETMTHIFDRFYRASNEVNPNSVGIGLSLSKSIVEGMGGRITVDSKLGEGSTFKLQF